MKKILVYSNLFVIFVMISAAASLAAERLLLGERVVSDRAEYDTIEVGQERGPFTGLQVRVLGSNVEFKRIEIHFVNGGQQVLDKNRTLGRGKTSAVLRLDGGKRLIEKVVFHYEARSRGWKTASIRLWGVP